MKSNLSEHQLPVDFAKLERDEINEILDWLDSDVEYYVRFMQWRQVRDAVKQAENEFMLGQGDSEEPDYEVR
jgi:hypothetical protein